MADEVLFEGGDGLTAETIGEAFGREGFTNFVQRGLNVVADYQAAVCDIAAGKVYLLHNGRDKTLLPDARAGVPLATDGVNHVFITITETQQDDGSTALGIGHEVNSDGGQPAGASLKIAEIDMAAGTVTETNRQVPHSDDNATRYKSNDIDSDGDGVVDASHTTEHVAGADVDGAVAEADHAAEATTAATLGDDTGGSFGGDIDGKANALTGLSNLRVDSANEDFGLALRAFAPQDGGSGAAITPHGATGAKLDSQLVYSDSNGRWRFETGLYVGGGELRVNRADGTPFGLLFNSVETPDGNSAATITPYSTNGQKGDSELVYDNSTDRWRSETEFVVTDGVFQIDDKAGTTFGLKAIVDTSASRPSAIGLTPYGPSGDKTDSQLVYSNGEDEWRVESGFAANGGVARVNTAEDLPFGLKIAANTAGSGPSLITLTPYGPDGDKTDSQLVFNNDTSEWRVEADFAVTGEYFKLPTTTQDPSDPPDGSMWFREDL